MTDVAETAAAPVADLETSGRYLDHNRSNIIPLKFPFAVGDIEFRQVTVRRITSREAKTYGLAVASYLTAVRAGQIDVLEPLYPGIELPREGFAMLDDDDMSGIEEAADGFFPERLKPLMAALNGALGLATIASTGEAEPAL